MPMPWQAEALESVVFPIQGEALSCGSVVLRCALCGEISAELFNGYRVRLWASNHGVGRCERGAAP